jgi:hypothetical protein
MERLRLTLRPVLTALLHLCTVFLHRVGKLARGSVTIIAYLDPGSGSLILQIIAGGLAAVAVTAKFYWRRLTRLLRIRRSAETEQGAERPRVPGRSNDT